MWRSRITASQNDGRCRLRKVKQGGCSIGLVGDRSGEYFGVDSEFFGALGVGGCRHSRDSGQSGCAGRLVGGRWATFSARSARSLARSGSVAAIVCAKPARASAFQTVLVIEPAIRSARCPMRLTDCSLSAPGVVGSGTLLLGITDCWSAILVALR